MRRIQEEKTASQRIGESMGGVAKQIIMASETIEEQAQEIDKMIEILMEVRETKEESQRKKVLILGAGRSGLIGQAFAKRLMHLGFLVFVIGETTTPSAEADDVIVVVSGSGTTRTVVATLDGIIEAKIEVKIIAITSHPRSHVGRWADLVIRLPGRDYASPDDTEEEEPPLSPLGSRFEINALAFLEALIRELMRITGTTEEEMAKRHEV